MSWKSIETFDRPDGEHVDVWMAWGASATTMGWSDSFKLEGGAWRENGRWFHIYKDQPTELQRDYVRFWAPLGEGPEAPDPWQEALDAAEYEKYRAQMRALSISLDEILNGEGGAAAQPSGKRVGFFLAVYDMEHEGPAPGCFNYISNSDKLDVRAMMKEIEARISARLQAEGNA